MLKRRIRLTAAALLVLLIAQALVHRFQKDVEAADPEIILKPPLGTGAGVGSFNYLDQAINDYIFDAAQSALEVRCSITCLNELEKVATWQGFPDGAEPLRLEIRWDGTGGIGAGSQARAYFLVEYDIGNGWETAEQDLWVNSIPTCSEAHPASCASHVYVKELSASVIPSSIKVRATHRMKMDVCDVPCNDATKHMLSTMNIRNIQVVAKAPTLEVDPGSTVTRGDAVTFWVKGAPEGTTYSNWRYEMPTQSKITRTGTINVDTWTGELVVSGTAKVVALVPRNLVSLTLSASAAVTARSWNSEPKDPPTPVTGITPGGIPSPPEPFPRLMGFAVINADYLWDGQAVPDGPNKGLSYVRWVNHDNVVGTRVEYEISPDVEPGTTFFNKQCGAGGFISGAVLRANGYEHESGTIKGHYQQYRSKLAEPTVNFANWAESQIGSVSGGYGSFAGVITYQLDSRAMQINSAASVEACNSDWQYDVNCAFRGNINFPPYQPPCQ